MQEVLRIDNLQKSFGEKHVLKGVNLTIPKGSIFGFIGGNGAGKTTAMKCILGLLSIDEGEISLLGEPVQFCQTPTNRHVGYLPDVPEFYPFMTAREYLVFCGKLMNAQEISKRADELLRLVGLQNEKSKIKGFSRGMKQRLGIAQALFNRPKLLICDEPTSALDPMGRKEILDVLRSVKEETTVLFSTHILSDVEKICTDVAFLHDGIIRYQGKIEEVKKKNSSTAFAVTLSSDEDTAVLYSLTQAEAKQEGNTLSFSGKGHAMYEVMQIILQKNLSFERVERKEQDLESLFLEVIGK